MVLQEEFVPSCAAMSREINIVRQATEGKNVLSCDVFIIFLRISFSFI